MRFKDSKAVTFDSTRVYSGRHIKMYKGNAKFKTKYLFLEQMFKIECFILPYGLSDLITFSLNIKQQFQKNKNKQFFP
jgi:hypothetical protein